MTSVAAISLLVRGIGIWNIMLVSVSERTRDMLGLARAPSLPLTALGRAPGVSTGVGAPFGLVRCWRTASLAPVLALGRK